LWSMKTARLVLAGAGSGKTSVIVGRAGYLVESGQAHPPEVLILAFGDNASQETDERIGERLPGTQGISTHTFHALGRKIIGQATGRMPSVSVLATNEETFGSYLLATVQQRSQEHKGYGDKVLYYLAAYPQPYRPPDTFESHEAYVRYPRTIRTSSGTGQRTGRTAISIPIWNRIIGGLNNALGPRVAQNVRYRFALLLPLRRDPRVSAAPIATQLIAVTGTATGHSSGAVCPVNGTDGHSVTPL
jgi:hypothetical protein